MKIIIIIDTILIKINYTNNLFCCSMADIGGGDAEVGGDGRVRPTASIRRHRGEGRAPGRGGGRGGGRRGGRVGMHADEEVPIEEPPVEEVPAEEVEQHVPEAALSFPGGPRDTSLLTRYVDHIARFIWDHPTQVITLFFLYS